MDGGRGGEGERADWLFCQWLWKEALVVLKVKTTPRCPVCHSNQHIEDIDGHRKSYLSCKVSILDNKCNSQCLFFEGFGIKYCEWVLRRWTCTVVWEGMVQHGVNHPPDVMSEPHFMWPCDNKNWIHQAKGERGKGLWLTPRGIEGRGAGKLGWKAESRWSHSRGGPRSMEGWLQWWKQCWAGVWQWRQNPSADRPGSWALQLTLWSKQDSGWIWLRK